MTTKNYILGSLAGLVVLMVFLFITPQITKSSFYQEGPAVAVIAFLALYTGVIFIATYYVTKKASKW